MPPTIDHFTTDTLPRVVAGSTPSAPPDLLLPFRITVDDPALQVVSWRLRVEVDGQEWSSRVRTRRLHPGIAANMLTRMQHAGVYSFEHLPYYARLDDGGIRAGRYTYVEGLVPRPPAAATVRYSLKATLRRDGDGSPVVVESPTWSTAAVDPRFTPDDVRCTFIPGAFRADEAWVLMHRRADGADQIRVDVVDLTTGDVVPEHAPLAVAVGGTTVVDLAAAPPVRDGARAVPLVDVAADSVTVAVPHAAGAPLPVVTVRYRDRTESIDLEDPPPVGETRVVFVNFAIQGLNDLFAGADVDYRPPRTYTQVTMRDENASYSSRPGSRETTTGDGYAFTVDAHRRFRVPQMWAMNGGLLGLLAHDAPDELALLAAAVDEKMLVPVVAGYGAHRLPYYSAATNLDAIAFGSDAMRSILGSTRPVYYPDSRITVGKPEVTDALRAAGMEFLVVDGGTESGLTPEGKRETNIEVTDVKPPMRDVDDHGRWVNWQYLWHDRRSDTKVLFIDPELKDNLLKSSESEADRGSIARSLRRKFVELAAQPTVRAGNLVVYSDDADKASGNGWFDGELDGGARSNNQRYQAALSWVATHPWVRAVTTDDLTDDDCIGDLDLVRATDPWIEAHWRLPAPAQGETAFDTWVDAWAGTRAAWLGDTFKAISDRAEKAIARRRRSGYTDELVLLARLYFLMCLHESQWSKRARIEEWKDPVHCDDPEDFVTAASIQTRNAHVYLNASFWAEWAAEVAAGRTAAGAHRDGGPVVARVAGFEEACLADENRVRPTWWREEYLGLQWDHDPLPTVVLYNEHALVVADRNGGRITHLFAMVDGRPCALSGTHKAYQFLTFDWLRDEGVQCDGIVLQNTVYTPNHAYVACDVDASLPTPGEPTSPEATFGWLYPDNFNAYEEIFDGTDEPGALPTATFAYGPTTPGAVAPATIAALETALADDRDDKVDGRPGLVLHDVDTFGAFAKTIRLDGRTVHVEYRDTRPGHRVANEFCVDLRASALDGRRQSASVDPDGRGAAVTNDAGLAVRLELGGGCAFSAATTVPSDPPTVESLRLHRVMTDDLEIVAPDGGDFSYRIVLP